MYSARKAHGSYLNPTVTARRMSASKSRTELLSPRFYSKLSLSCAKYLATSSTWTSLTWKRYMWVPKVTLRLFYTISLLTLFEIVVSSHSHEHLCNSFHFMLKAMQFIEGCNKVEHMRLIILTTVCWKPPIWFLT